MKLISHVQPVICRSLDHGITIEYQWNGSCSFFREEQGKLSKIVKNIILIADVSLEIVIGMLLLTLSNVNIDFLH